MFDGKRIICPSKKAKNWQLLEHTGLSASKDNLQMDLGQMAIMVQVPVESRTFDQMKFERFQTSAGEFWRDACKLDDDSWIII